MKLLNVIHDYLPLHLGGSELHAHQMGAEFVRRGHDVVALFTERHLESPQGEERQGSLDGVRTIEVVHHREYEDVRETWEQRRSLEVFRRVLAREAPDLVHFHHLALWGSACLRATAEAGLPAVLTLHDYHLICDNAVLLREDGTLCTDGPRASCATCLRRHPLLPERWPPAAGTPGAGGEEDLYARGMRERFEAHRRDLARVSRAICPSRFLADVFQQADMLSDEQIVVTKYGYPGALREPRRTDPCAPLRVGYIGGIYPSKGVHVLVEAFTHLQGQPLELHVHGMLDWFPDYVNDLRRTADSAAITFHGGFDPTAVDEVLGGVDLLVVPSIWYENMPITIQEAFRNGLPVVATDLGGMAEAVEHGRSGLLFPRGDAAALAELLSGLAADRKQLARLAAGRPAIPGIGEVADLLEGVYGELGVGPS